MRQAFDEQMRGESEAVSIIRPSFLFRAGCVPTCALHVVSLNLSGYDVKPCNGTLAVQAGICIQSAVRLSEKSGKGRITVKGDFFVMLWSCFLARFTPTARVTATADRLSVLYTGPQVNGGYLQDVVSPALLGQPKLYKPPNNGLQGPRWSWSWSWWHVEQETGYAMASRGLEYARRHPVANLEC
jgi:hypothetical protein